MSRGAGSLNTVIGGLHGNKNSDPNLKLRGRFMLNVQFTWPPMFSELKLQERKIKTYNEGKILSTWRDKN